jgi:hypothetical protein
MKRFLLCIGFLLSVMVLEAQEDFENKKIMILPESELIIVGSTNVNKFDCSFQIDLISEPMTLRFAKREEYVFFNNLKLQLHTRGFDCGNKRMNSDFQDLLLGEKYSDIVIELDRIESISTEYIKAYITVYLAGKSNTYNLPVVVNEDRFKGKFKMNIRDFGLEPPTKALGLIEVDEQIEVQFDLKVLR